jgi:hypothetical protein
MFVHDIDNQIYYLKNSNMKKLFSKTSRFVQNGKSFVVNNRLVAIIVPVLVVLIIYSCNKQKAADSGVAVSDTKLKTNSAQPLPQGRQYFSVVMGNFDHSGYTWNRIMQWTFNAAAGTVTGKSWTWESDIEDGKTALAGHRCTFDGKSSICPVFTPTGWNGGSTVRMNVAWAGTYTYNTTTGRLVITWSSPAAGATDSWDVTIPSASIPIARVQLVSSSYTLTHGRGYGSNASPTAFKTLQQMVADGLPTYTSTTARQVAASTTSPTGAVTVAPDASQPGVPFNAWAHSAMVMGTATVPSSPVPANCVHKWEASNVCNINLGQNPRTGEIYHYWADNTDRKMTMTNWCACLPAESEFPCYDRGLHPSAILQVLDDNGVLRGFVGVETQNDPGSAGYEFTLWDFSNI